jgi:hypothetical protein
MPDQVGDIERLVASAGAAADRGDLGAAIDTYKEVIDGFRAAATRGDPSAAVGELKACATLGELLEQTGDRAAARDYYRASLHALEAASPHIDGSGSVKSFLANTTSCTPPSRPPRLGRGRL